MTSSIYVNNLPRQIAAAEQKEGCFSDVLGPAGTSQRNRGARLLLQPAYILARGRENQAWRYSIHDDARGEIERQHVCQQRQDVFARLVGHVRKPITQDLLIEEVNDVAARSLFRECVT